MKNNQNKELVLLEDLGMQYASKASKQKRRYGLYKCYCGNEFRTSTYEVNSRRIISCGCNRREKLIERSSVHKLCKHRLYNIWSNMISRCYKENHKRYSDWGGRGITVCEEWHKIENFIDDMYPSFIEGLTLDRKNNNLGYSIDNCRWTTKTTQSRNQRLIKVNNKSGYRGVNWSKTSDKFRARIMVKPKRIHLGYFDTAFEAAKAYDKYILDNILEHTRNFS